MSVRFVLGRAGTGKTYHCLEAIRQRLRADPIDGPRLILLVPEQASYQMERAILESSGKRPAASLAGAHRAEVLSFKRLAVRVLEAAGGPARCALTESARAMVLRRLLTDHAEDLQYYGRVARHGHARRPVAGFVDRLGATLAEFIEEAITPDELAPMCEDARPPVKDPAQRAKLHDLLLLYRAYLDYLGDDKLDPSQHLQLARERLPQCEWLDGAELWVDGFASLSGQESLMLLTLVEMSSRAELTALLDPRLRSTNAPATAPHRAAARLFSRTWTTYQNLNKRLRQQGLSIDEPVILAPNTPPRFQRGSALARLEQSLFGPPDDSGEPPVNAPPDVEVVELPSRRIEVDYAVSRICRWVQDESTGYRYRDMAIIVRDLEPYHDLITQSLAARNIPFFMDRRRPTTHHPLIELVRALVTVVQEDLSTASVRLLLKTDLLPMSDEARDELENYLIAHGIAGAAAWSEHDWTFRERTDMAAEAPEPTTREKEALERINAARRAVLAFLDPWPTAFPPDASRSAAEWSEALTAWLTRVEVGQTLQHWAREAEADGELDQAEEHRQVWRDVLAFLDDLAFALSDTPLTIRDLAEVLDSGLSGLTLGLIPPTVDQVLVGSIERSRHPDIKAAVILGFNDGVFPKPQTEDSVLNDDDRTALLQAGLSLRPSSRELVLDEMMLAYIALTRASEAVVVTYAVSDDSGKALFPAPYVDAIRAALPTLEVQHVANPLRSRDTWNILTQSDLAERLTMEFRSRPSSDHDDQSLRTRWNELYEVGRTELAGQTAVCRAFAALDEPDEDGISAAPLKRFQPGPLQASISRLETYAACPFQYYARYMLGLKQRPEAVLQEVDVGQIHHAILEEFVTTLSDRRQGFDPMTDAELLSELDESCRRIATRLPTDARLSDARNGYVLRRSATDLQRVIRAQRRLGQASAARPFDTTRVHVQNTVAA